MEGQDPGVSPSFAGLLWCLHINPTNPPTHHQSVQVRGQESAKYTVQLKIYNNNFFLSVYFIRGAFIKKKWEKLGFCPNQGGRGLT